MRKKNGFFYFALACEEKEKGYGRRFRNFDEVISHAGKIWKHMGPRQREPYIEIAERQRMGAEKAKARDSRPSASRLMQTPTAERIPKAEQIKRSIQKRIEQAELDEGLDKEQFYIISMVYFCHTFQGGYVPAELGVVKFSIQDGVLDHLHMHINPGKLPLGMALEAQQHAAHTHGLPLPPNALGEANYDKIARKLLAFLDVKDEIPALFTHANDVPMVESMLGDIMRQHTNGQTLYVSTVAELFYRLKLGAEYHMMSMTLFPSVERAQELINEDCYNHSPNISCDYHEGSDLSAVCALSKSTRSAYTIVMNCCQEMSVQPIPGQHFPSILQERSLESLLDDMVKLNKKLNAAAAEMPDGKERTGGNKARYADSQPSCSGLQKRQAAYMHESTDSDLDTSDPVPVKRSRYFD